MRLVIFLLGLLGFVHGVQAKDLSNRLGVGIKNNTSFSLPALAAIYYPNSDIGLTGGLGLDTQKDNSKFAFNIGIRRILFKEDNMNFHFGGSLGMITNQVATVSSNGFELNALFGGEFFIHGMDSLGFNFEGGVGVVSTSEVRFRTVADDIFRAGIVFYF